MKCDICKIREAAHVHHAVITRAQARNVPPEAMAIVESVENKLDLCERCHTGSGHIPRSKSVAAIDAKHGEGTAERVLAEFSKAAKVDLGMPKKTSAAFEF